MTTPWFNVIAVVIKITVINDDDDHIWRIIKTSTIIWGSKM